jgi:hypothetical protein
MKDIRNKESLLKAFEELKEALKNCNRSTLEKIISDDYSGIGLQGTIENKENILYHFKPGGIKLSRYDVEEIKHEVLDNIGFVSGRGMIAGSYGEYEFKHTVLFTDIFKYTRGMWKYYKSQVTEIAPV